MISNYTVLSNILLIARYFTDLFLEYYFNKEMMFASINYQTIPSCRDMLNTCASGILICFIVSFCVYVLSRILLVTYCSYCYLCLCAIPYTSGDVLFILVNVASYYLWGYNYLLQPSPLSSIELCFCYR